MDTLLENLHLGPQAIGESLAEDKKCSLLSFIQASESTAPPVLLLCELMRDEEMPLEVKALSLADGAGVDLSIRQLVRDVLAVVLPLQQLLDTWYIVMAYQDNATL